MLVDQPVNILLNQARLMRDCGMFPQLGAFVRFDLSIPMYIPQFIPCLKILKGLSFLLAAISITFWGKP